MRIAFALVAIVLVTPAPAMAQPAPPARSDAPSHPPEVAWVDEGRAGAVYRETAHSLRLYTYDRDPPGASVCVEGCASAWPPLIAPAKSAPVGEWTIVVRNDGFNQWAYRAKPVYMHYHDSPSIPTGDGTDSVWHLLPYSTTG